MLYSPEILAAAVGLADFPLLPPPAVHGEARSRNCGSTLTIALEVDDTGRVARSGCRAQACAVGQAAAHVFLVGAAGRTASDFAEARAGLASWLHGGAARPDWPGISLLEPARDHPARHGAILLAWDAALAALASPPPIR